VPRSQISSFCKNQPLEEPCALWCTSFTSCPEAFHDGEKILQGAGLLHVMEKNLLGGSVPVKETKRPRQQKEQQQQKMKQQ